MQTPTILSTRTRSLSICCILALISLVPGSAQAIEQAEIPPFPVNDVFISLQQIRLLNIDDKNSSHHQCCRTTESWCSSHQAERRLLLPPWSSSN